MKAIYTPKGPAAEYAEGWATNPLSGCTNGCAYCYVPNVLRMDRAKFHSEVKSRPGYFKALERDLKNLPPNQMIFLSFTCDPFGSGHPARDTDFDTLVAIRQIQEAGHRVRVLTKSGMHSYRDEMGQIFRPGLDEFGVTLATAWEADSIKIEPGADMPISRIAALGIAQMSKITTWVSFEPIIKPEWTFRALKGCFELTDLGFDYCWFGLPSGMKRLAPDYRAGIEEIIAFCDKEKINYKLKASLRKALGA